MIEQIAVTSDLGRVTTKGLPAHQANLLYCGDIRSRTSYNMSGIMERMPAYIAVTSDLGRVTTSTAYSAKIHSKIAVTSDLGRVTTLLGIF